MELLLFLTVILAFWSLAIINKTSKKIPVTVFAGFALVTVAVACLVFWLGNWAILILMVIALVYSGLAVRMKNQPLSIGTLVFLIISCMGLIRSASRSERFGIISSSASWEIAAVVITVIGVIMTVVVMAKRNKTRHT